MNMTTLKEFASKAIGDVAEVGGAAKPTFALDKAYLIEVTGVAYKLSQYGRHQVEISLAKVQADDSLKNAGKIWLDLPVFSDEENSTLDAEKLNKARKARANTFSQLLGILLPETFGFGKGSAKERAAGVQGAAQMLVDGEEIGGVGQRGYIVKATNANNEKYPYTNFYSEQPTKVPMADA